MISREERKFFVVGYKQVLKSLEKGVCEKIFIAEDCSPSMLDALVGAAGSVPVSKIPTMRELGREYGIDVPASCAAKIRL